MTDVPAEFIRAHTRSGRPPLVPEITLRMADDVVALWEAMEPEHTGPGSEPPFWAAAWPGGQALARYVLDHPDLVAGRTVLDVLLAGDVCYDRAMTERTLPFLGRAWLAGAAVFLADPGRPYLPRDALVRVADFDVPDTEGGPEVRRTTVWRLP